MSDDSATEETDTEPTEVGRVALWRFLQLIGAGYPDDIAWIIATRDDLDLHQAVELLEHGATVKQAEKILL